MKIMKAGKWKAGISVVAVAFVMVVSAGTYASEYSVSAEEAGSGYDSYTDLRDENGELVEFEIPAEELDLSDAVIIAGNIDSGVASPQYVSGSINSWKIPAHTSYTTNSFYKSAGSTIYIGISVIPGSKTVQAGIIRPDGNAVCVQGTTALSHTFNCASSGYYTVYVRNLSDTKVTVNGAYTH